MKGAASTLGRLIRSLLRLTSVSSQTSPCSPEWGRQVSAGSRPDGGGGAFSWSLRCSSWRTSSVFSRCRSPGPGVTMALWAGRTARHRALAPSRRRRTLCSLPDHGGSGPRVVLRLGGATG